MTHALRLSALVFLPLFAVAATTAEELCIEKAHGLCCNPCDLVYDLETTGYSTEGAPCETPGYERVSISLSATDPSANVGAFPGDNQLYLWLSAATSGYGFAWAYLELGGDFYVTEYTHLGPGTGGLDPSTQTLGFNVPCVHGLHLVGSMLIVDPTPVETDSWGSVKGRWR